MTATPPFVATYRLQLRNGVGLGEAQRLLPRLVELGVSHLYLSPLFHAASGSTHGYDVIDPNAVDPVLGGEAGFLALSDAAGAAGIGLVLDIVPNHMAFTPENDFVADLMRHGRDSQFARVFDIDWDKGPLHFPVLDGMVEDVLEAGQIAVAGTPQAPALAIYGQDFPLRPTMLAQSLSANGGLDAPTLAALLSEQWWSVGDWRETERAIIHRRFFNITGLIGVRQEDAGVFSLTHRWIAAQARAGRIQGLRVDHIDGLARPGGYLHRLREAAGGVPIWVEKIVKDGEDIPPNWPIQGMSGYEFMAPVTQLLTHASGLRAMREAAAGAVPVDTQAEVRQVRAELLAGTLAPELRRVAAAGAAALACSGTQLRAVGEAAARLALGWPVYRSYAADGCPLDPSLDALREPDGLTGALLDLLHAAADDAPARNLAARFEQLTGALTAKSEEDTVFFRAAAYLPFCEVGAGPDLDPLAPAGFEQRMQARAQATPFALNALSTHDTKRSADARAAIMALSFCPALARHLVRHGRRRAEAEGLPGYLGIYAIQVALMMKDEARADDRIPSHMEKALREAKDLSTHEAPNAAAERRSADLCLEFVRELARPGFWAQGCREEFERIFEQIVLAQVALQISAPGIPDIYQGSEGVQISLTDPDNRRPIDGAAGGVRTSSGLDGKKRALTQDLLRRRALDPELFAKGAYELRAEPGRWTVVRRWQSREAQISTEMPMGMPDGSPLQGG